GERNSYSKTDPDATFMRLKEDAMNNGQTKPAYNLQIATENQYWTNFALYPNPTDTLTFKPFLDKYKKRYGKQSKSVTADSGYGSEENYEYLEMEEMMGYVKYNWFHKEQHKPFKEDAFNQANFYYNKDDDYYVCPMGQHMEPCRQRQTKSDSGYVSVITLYRAQRCDGCPFGSLCKKSKGNRTIYVNHKLNAYKKEAFLLLTSEEGMKHRSQRPIEPEAAFGQMKADMHYKRFRHFGKAKVYMDIGLFGIGFNLKKYLGIKR
ncbi:transposase, partial [Prevotella copri]